MTNNNALPDLTDFSPLGRIRLAIAFLEKGRDAIDKIRCIEVAIELIDSAREELGLSLIAARMLASERLTDGIIGAVAEIVEAP